MGQNNSYIKEVGCLSAPSNFLAQRFHNVGSKMLGLTILGVTNGRNSVRSSKGWARYDANLAMETGCTDLYLDRGVPWHAVRQLKPLSTLLVCKRYNIYEYMGYEDMKYGI